jgi:hypothetical protein
MFQSHSYNDSNDQNLLASFQKLGILQISNYLALYLNNQLITQILRLSSILKLKHHWTHGAHTSCDR